MKYSYCIFVELIYSFLDSECNNLKRVSEQRLTLLGLLLQRMVMAAHCIHVFCCTSKSMASNKRQFQKFPFVHVRWFINFKVWNPVRHSTVKPFYWIHRHSLLIFSFKRPNRVSDSADLKCICHVKINYRMCWVFVSSVQ